MTIGREEAITLLHEISDQCCEIANILCTEDADKRCEAIDMAIEVLSKPTCKKCTNLINKEDAIDALDEFIKPFVGLIGDMGAAINGAREVIKDVPSTNRPMGEWINKGRYAECSICGAHTASQFDGVELVPLKTKFCHHCGAEMKVPLYVYASWDRSEE